MENSRSRFSACDITDKQALFELLPSNLLTKLGFSLDTNSRARPNKHWTNKDGAVNCRRFTSPNKQVSIIIRRDSHEILIETRLQKRLLIRCGIRDRSLDGRGKHGRQAPLNQFAVNHELANALPHKNFRSAELSVYSYDPDCSPPATDLATFINDPDRFIFPWNKFKFERFSPLWKQAFRSGLAPWQSVPPIKGFAQHFVLRSIEALKQLGYHRAEAVPGWYNAALFFKQRLNFRFINLEHQAAFELLQAKLADLEHRHGKQYDPREQAWIVALQNIPEVYLKSRFADYYLGGIHWLNSPTSSDYCTRLCLDLNQFPAEAAS